MTPQFAPLMPMPITMQATLPTARQAAPRPESFENLLASYLQNASQASVADNLITRSVLTGQGPASTHTWTVAGAKSDVLTHLTAQCAQRLSQGLTTLLQMQI